MNDVALTYSIPSPRFDIRASKMSALAVEISILGLLLSLLQIADGILTAIGVLHFGADIEGNALLRSLMQQYGVIATLATVKILAIGVVVLLCRFAFVIPWLRTALKAVIGLYLFAAVLPWAYILFTSF